MKKFILILLIIIIAAASFGCFNSVKLENNEIDAFSYTKRSSSADDSVYYSLIRKGENAKMHCELYAGNEYFEYEAPVSVLDEIYEIAKKYDMQSWNAFNKSNTNAMDGESFNLTIELSDGSIIEASGNNSFPENYFDATHEITELLNKIIEDNKELIVKWEY